MTIPIPSVSSTFRDGSLGALAVTPDVNVYVIGAASSGTDNEIKTYSGVDPQAAKTQFTSGSLVDAGVHVLQKSKGRGQVHLVKGAMSTAGAPGAVSQSGGGPLPTLSLTPADDFSNRIKIITGGAVATATFQHSRDGGKNYGPTLTTAATYDLDTGVRVTFVAGTYVADEVYSWEDTGPKNTNADISAALDAILASSTSGRVVLVAGHAADAADTETIATTVHSKLTTAEGSHRYMVGIVESPPVAASLLIAEFADFQGSRVIVTGGYGDLFNSVTTATDKRALGRSVAARLARNGISIDPMRNDTDTDISPIDDMSIPDGQADTTAYHLENVTPGFNDAGFTYAMKFPDIAGVYIGNTLTMAPPSSDFRRATYRMIVDTAADVAYRRGVRHLQKKLRVDKVSGKIAESQARSLEGDINQQLVGVLVNGGHAVDAFCVVDRETNLLSSPTLKIKVFVTPFGHATAIEYEIGLFNPANVPIAA